METPRERWILLESGPGDPEFNMALDEALLATSALRGAPVLRLYSWQHPAATFGYSQRWAEVRRLTPLRPLIRRPTGGGLVPHAGDWTYSVVVPPAQPWHTLRARDSYRRMHGWIADSLNRIGVPVSLAERSDPQGPGCCFVGAEEADVLCQGRKVAGAAQRRNRQGLLIQGSVQPLVGSWSREAFHRALRESAEQAWGCLWEEGSLTPSLVTAAELLIGTKYGRDSYNQRR